MSIRSLFNLTKKINNHILNISPKEKFNLLDINPYLKEYRGNDWNNYVCNIVEKKYYKNGFTSVKEADRPLYILYVVLKEAKKEKRRLVV